MKHPYRPLGLLLLFLLIARACVGAEVTVTAAKAKVMSGETVIATVSKGHTFPVVERRNSWYRIRFTLGGKVQSGWISQSDVTSKSKRQLAEEELRTVELEVKELDRIIRVLEQALVRVHAGKPQEAVDICKRHLSEVRKEGTPSRNVAYALEAVGNQLTEAGTYDEAQSYYEQALAMSHVFREQKRTGFEGPLLASIGAALLTQGDLRNAKQYLQQAESKLVLAHGSRDASLASLHATLCQLARAEQDFATAQRHAEIRLDICRASYGNAHDLTIAAIQDLGALKHDMGDTAGARECFETAIRFYRDKSQRSTNLAISLSNLALVCMRQKEYDLAHKHFTESLEISRSIYGDEHDRTANVYYNLGGLRFRQGQVELARETHEKALSIWRDTFGKGNRQVGKAYNAVGWDSYLLHDDATADENYKLALESFEATFGTDNNVSLTPMRNLSLLHASTRSYEEANRWTDSAARLSRRYLSELLPSLSSRDKSSFLVSHDEDGLDVQSTLGWLQRNNPQMAATSATWLVNGKAVSQEALVQQIVLARRGASSESQLALADLADIRSQLARQGFKSVRAEQRKTHQQRLAKLQEREAELSKTLAQQNIDVSKPATWIELESIRKRLEDNEVLIEIARFKVRDFRVREEPTWLPSRYAAWLIPADGKGSVRIVDFGDAETIDTAVRSVREALTEGAELIRMQGEPQATDVVLKSLTALSDLILKPLLVEIGDAEQLVISPDASLWLVPWDALPLEDGRFAIESYRIRYLVCGRQLVTHRDTWPTSASAPLILADPDFDLAPSDALAETNALVNETFALRSAELNGSLPKVLRLSGTAAEAQAVFPSLQQYCQAEPRMYTGPQALEGVFKATRSPKVVTLSTHGFFLADQHFKSDSVSFEGQESQVTTVTTEGNPFENPLLRCGLLLAGCNNRDQSGEDQDDGVLTGLEIVGTDLRGTELVVLSACDTGVGQIQNGEGVAGLRQAFQLAGAESVVASLWQVDDRQTARLMQDFFSNLAADQSASIALRNAQLNMIRARRERNGAAHPFYWAAFTLTTH